MGVAPCPHPVELAPEEVATAVLLPVRGLAAISESEAEPRPSAARGREPRGPSPAARVTSNGGVPLS
eukprot:11385675-Alexandrium_andersonii.AAC.1